MPIVAFHNHIIVWASPGFVSKTRVTPNTSVTYKGLLLISTYHEYGRLQTAIDHCFVKDGDTYTPDLNIARFYDTSSDSFSDKHTAGEYSCAGWVINSDGEIWEVHANIGARSTASNMALFLFERICYGEGVLRASECTNHGNIPIFLEKMIGSEDADKDARLAKFVRALAVHWPEVYNGRAYEITSLCKSLKEDKPNQIASLQQLREKGQEYLNINEGFVKPPAKTVRKKRTPKTKTV